MAVGQKELRKTGRIESEAMGGAPWGRPGQYKKNQNAPWVKGI